MSGIGRGDPESERGNTPGWSGRGRHCVFLAAVFFCGISQPLHGHSDRIYRLVVDWLAKKKLYNSPALRGVDGVKYRRLHIFKHH